ncbi:hypothetical protein ASG01_07255 [Chryseobacterium sp. Leaf180]|uniref:DUF1801 domain-containing protein n=1 Tax=Chryseobacterium sp. Leaf180 TaxID=1736289 RepID=UPI0006FC4B3A|nr:DUF1801 domain-containing protein [Chryseobacterium sp. Leaf180]KQR93668.1 hypothetical protein ASG01_07255 [Chryseobacterium sp. Leaf180]
MQITAPSFDEYLKQIPEDRQKAFQKLFETLNKNIPQNFEVSMSGGMINWVVPLEIYPAGYHCTPGSPLPFLAMASQKNFIALYHMGIYAKPELLNWFVEEFPKHSKKKLDMGKSCIRFKKPDDIPFELIAELSKKMSAEEWIAVYEKNFKK